jgi:hypothetical protein
MLVITSLKITYTVSIFRLIVKSPRVARDLQNEKHGDDPDDPGAVKEG